MKELQRINLLGEFEPQKVAAEGAGDACRRREIAGGSSEHRALLQFEGVTQFAQMAVIAAMLEVVGERGLGGDRRGEGGHELEAVNLLGVTSACHPADPIAGREGLGKRAAVHHQSAAIQAFQRVRRLGAVIQFGVHIVLDQRDLMLFQQVVEPDPVFLSHARAQWVLKAAHEPASLDRQACQAVLQRVEVHAVTRMHGDFDGFQLQTLQHLKAGIERRGFDGDQVAGPGDALQAQVQGFHRAIGDDQFVSRQAHATDHVAQGDLSAQFGIPGGHVADDARRRQRTHS